MLLIGSGSQLVRAGWLLGLAVFNVHPRLFFIVPCFDRYIFGSLISVSV